jgi:hypothetical protein
VDGNWGGLVDVEKNLFNGMIGMIQRKVWQSLSKKLLLISNQLYHRLILNTSFGKQGGR